MCSNAVKVNFPELGKYNVIGLGNECCTWLSRRFTVEKDEIAWKANGDGATGECSDTYSTYIETSLERQIGS